MKKIIMTTLAAMIATSAFSATSSNKKVESVEKTKEVTSAPAETTPVVANILETKDFKNGSFGNLKEGIDYLKIPVPQSDSENFVGQNNAKPSVLDFFWYGCGHCNNVRPFMNQLVKNYPDTPHLKQAVAFKGWEAGTKMFIIFKMMGIEDKMHDITFDAIHKNRQSIYKSPADTDAFLKANGVDVAKYHALENSFNLGVQYRKAEKITTNYKLEGTPMLGVYYRGYAYLTSPQLAKGYAQSVQYTQLILDKIIAEDKASKK